MARNRVQFQKGLSTAEFRKRYGTEAQCHAALVEMRWPNGDYAKANIDAEAKVMTDGLACFNGFAEAGLEHVVRITGGGRPMGGDFKWVNTGLGNVKSAITGTCRSIDARHTPRYLAAYEWRYNRRFDLPANLGRLARVAVTIKPKPYREIAAVRPRKIARKTAETPG